MSATADLLGLQIQAPVVGAFVLNRSALNGPDKLATGDQAGYEWTPLLCDATAVRIRRGGTRDGVSTTLDVGTLDATFRVEGDGAGEFLPDPTRNPDMRPGVAVRAVRAAPPVPVPYAEDFEAALPAWSGTGTWQWSTAHARSGTRSARLAVTTGGTGYRWNPVPLAGLVPGRRYVASMWVTRGAAPSAGHVVMFSVPGAGETVEVRPGVEWTQVRVPFTPVAGGTPLFVQVAAQYLGFEPTASIWIDDVRVEWDADSDAIYTGTTGDATVSYDKLTDTAYSALFAVDAVRDLANTMRYGAANPVAEHEPWERRAERLLVSSPVPFVLPPLVPLVEVTIYGATIEQAAIEGNLWSTQGLWAVGLLDPDHTKYLQIPLDFHYRPRPTTGFVPGQRYRVTFDVTSNAALRYGVDGIETIAEPPATAPDFDERRRVVHYEFTATATTHGLVLRGQAQPFDPPYAGHTPLVLLYRLAVEPLTAAQCANVVYESTLVNHLDLVANTAQVGWFVDSLDRVSFTSPLAGPPPIAAHLSDVHSSDPLHVCYTHADVTYDTRGLVSDLTLSNHARAWDAEAGGYRADDRNIGPFRDEVAGATWGRRGASLETCIADVPGTAWADSSTRLARDVLDTYSTPHVVIRRVTFDAHAHPDLATALDVYDRVRVTHRSVTQTSRVVAIEHDATPTTWTVTLDLMEDF